MTPSRENIDRIRDPKVLARIAEMKAMGMKNPSIMAAIKEEFGFEPAHQTIDSITKHFSVTGSVFLEKENDMAELYKTALKDLLNSSKNNVVILGELRDELNSIMKMLRTQSVLEGDSKKKFNEYLREIQNIIRTLDNSISTQKGILDLFNKEKKEVTMSSTKHAQQTLEELEALEDEGIIIINPEFKDKRKKKKKEVAQDA